MTIWPFLILVLIGVILYMFWQHVSRGRQLSALFREIAPRYDGTVVAGDVSKEPELKLTVDGQPVHVVAMATGLEGRNGASSSAGPFTSVRLELPYSGSRVMHVSPKTNITGPMFDHARLIHYPATNDSTFDSLFQIRASDGPFVTGLFDETVREQIRQADLPSLDIRLAGNLLSVLYKGYPRSSDDIEAAIGIARALAKRFPPKPELPKGLQENAENVAT